MCNDGKKQLFVFEHDAGRLELLNGSCTGS